MKKRTWSLLLAAALLIALIGGAVPATALWVANEVPMGNVDGDEKITSTDARLVLQYYADKIDEEELDLVLADVDGDKEITSTDARLLLQYYADKIDEFPCGPVYAYTNSEAETTPNENPESFADYTSGNPIITSIFTADPSAHVWNDGRLYVYPSHDVFPAQGCDRMDKYHIYSTDNMVDFVDEGEIFSSADVMWSNCNGFMWAPDCCYIEETDTYYYFFPHPLTDDTLTVAEGQTDRGWNWTWVMGVAKSVGSPTGPFEQLGYVKLDESLYTEEELADNSPFELLGQNNQKKTQTTGWFDSSVLADLPARDGKTLGDHGVSGAALGGYSIIDPCAFVDDDGKVYLYYGGGSRCFVVELGEDMVTAVGKPKVLTGLPDFHEGSWVFKNPETGMYYNVYADNTVDLDGDGQNEGNQMRYSYALSPTGPFYAGGVVLTPTGCDTSHGSVTQYKGNWYLFYHNSKISGQGNLRSVCVDRLYFDDRGLIQTVKQTTTGVEAVGPASTATGIEDKYSPAGIDTSRYTVKTDYGLDVCTAGGGASQSSASVSNMHVASAYATFSGIDGGKGGRALLTVYYAAQGNATSKVLTDSELCVDGYFLRMDSTGSWSNYDGVGYCLIDLNAGTENTVTLLGGSGFNLRGISISLLPENVE